MGMNADQWRHFFTLCKLYYQQRKQAVKEWFNAS